MRHKKLRITEADYLKANRRASRQEEIESHGHPVQGRAMIHKSKKVYDRNRIKRAAIKSDDSSHFFSERYASLYIAIIINIATMSNNTELGRFKKK